MKIIKQIIPVHESIRLAWYQHKEGNLIDYTKPLGLALVESGKDTSISFFDEVDKTINLIDEEDPNYLGSVDRGNPEDVARAEEVALGIFKLRNKNG